MVTAEGARAPGNLRVRPTAGLAAKVNPQTLMGLGILAAVGLLSALVGDRGHPGVFWLLGLAFGFVLQRSRFCFASAFRELFMSGHAPVMRGVLAGMAVTTVGFAIVEFKLLPAPNASFLPAEAYITPVGLNLVLGGLLFGTGMVLAGGCVSGSLYRVGEGYVASWVAVGGVLLGLLALAHTWNWWWIHHLSKMPFVWLPAYLGYGGSVALTLLMLLAAYVLLLWWESRVGAAGMAALLAPRKPNRPGTVATVGGQLYALWRRAFKEPWPVVTAGAALGVLNVFLYVVHMPWGVTGELGRWATAAASLVGLGPGPLAGAGKLAGCNIDNVDPSFVTHGLMVNGGLIAGSFAAALLANEFKIRRPRQRRRYVQALGGGIFMGYGAGLALGCTIGGFFSAIPSLGLNGWVFGLSLLPGAFLGVQLVKRLP